MRRGAAWELQLEIWNRQYGLAGQAFVVKTHPEAKMAGGRIIYSSTGPPDFMGLLAGGRGVGFEAKEVSSHLFPMKNLANHQFMALRAIDRLGGVAFIAIQQMSGDQVESRRIIPWVMVEANMGVNSSVPMVGLPMMPETGWLSAFV